MVKIGKKWSENFWKKLKKRVKLIYWSKNEISEKWKKSKLVKIEILVEKWNICEKNAKNETLKNKILVKYNNFGQNI